MFGLGCSWAFWFRTTSLRPKTNLGLKTNLGHKINNLGPPKCVRMGLEMMQQKSNASQHERKNTNQGRKREGWNKSEEANFSLEEEKEEQEEMVLILWKEGQVNE